MNNGQKYVLFNNAGTIRLKNIEEINISQETYRNRIYIFFFSCLLCLVASCLTGVMFEFEKKKLTLLLTVITAIALGTSIYVDIGVGAVAITIMGTIIGTIAGAGTIAGVGAFAVASTFAVAVAGAIAVIATIAVAIAAIESAVANIVLFKIFAFYASILSLGVVGIFFYAKKICKQKTYTA